MKRNNHTKTAVKKSDLRLLIQNENRSPEFWVAYHALIKGAEKKSIPYIGSLPFADDLKGEEFDMLTETATRLSKRHAQEVRDHRKMVERSGRRLFITSAKNRKGMGEVMQRQGGSMAVWRNFIRRYEPSMQRTKSPVELEKLFGSYLKDLHKRNVREKEAHIADMKAVKERLSNKLDLYACSGELEFLAVDRRKVDRMRGSVNGWTIGDFWNLGRDGGGQHELRFRIAGNVPNAACSIVSRLGGASRMGGHIHINCKADSLIGRKVYSALRRNLCWMRWLVPESRRANHFCGVSMTPVTFDEATSRKYAAISANTWSYTGTIEMRLWPSSSKAIDWQNRAKLMQSIAKWSEGYTLDELQALAVLPIARDQQASAWRSYYLWASENDAEALLIAINLLRAKSRQSSSDARGATEAGELVSQFNASSTRLVGYRRPRVSRAVTA